MTWRLDWESVKRNSRWDDIRSRTRIEIIKLRDGWDTAWIADAWRTIRARDWRPQLWLGIAVLVGMFVSAVAFNAREMGQGDRLQTQNSAATFAAASRHAQAIDELNRRHAAEASAAATQSAQAIDELNRRHAAEVSAAASQSAQAIDELNHRHAAELGALKSQLATTDGRLAEVGHRLADANKRLADIETFETPRHLNYDQRRKLIAALAPFRGQKLTITSVLGNSETRAYRDDFVQVFDAAGWEHDGENGVVESAYDVDPIGIEVAVHQINDHEGLSNDAINALIKVLRELNLFETGGPKMSPMVPAGQFELRIGYKAHKSAAK